MTLRDRFTNRIKCFHERIVLLAREFTNVRNDVRDLQGPVAAHEKQHRSRSSVIGAMRNANWGSAEPEYRLTILSLCLSRVQPGGSALVSSSTKAPSFDLLAPRTSKSLYTSNKVFSLFLICSSRLHLGLKISYKRSLTTERKHPRFGNNRARAQL